MHPKKKAKLAETLRPFVEHEWKLPCSGTERAAFILSKLGGKRHKLGKRRLRVCSCIRANLERLQLELKRYYDVNALVSGKVKNSRGDSYFELSINKLADVEKIRMHRLKYSLNYSMSMHSIRNVSLSIAALYLLLLFAGCVSSGQGRNGLPEQDGCIQVITSAVSPAGECREYATPCDVPEGYFVVEGCPRAQGEPAVEDGNEPAAQDGNGPAAQEAKYSFDTNLVFCDFDKYNKKLVFFYRIKNLVEDAPEYLSKVALHVPDLNYSTSKMIQSSYGAGRTLWEEKSYSYLGITYRGQEWEVRSADANLQAPMHYSLVLCAPEVSGPCTSSVGTVLDSGITTERCAFVKE